MQDFESIALGLRPRPAQAALQKNEHLALSHAEAAVVSRLPNSTEYNAILKIMEGEIEKLETEHMQNWKDKDLFERTGLVAVAARTLYERFQIEINFHSSEFRGNEAGAELDKAVEEMSPEEFIRRGFGMDE